MHTCCIAALTKLCPERFFAPWGSEGIEFPEGPPNTSASNPSAGDADGADIKPDKGAGPTKDAR